MCYDTVLFSEGKHKAVIPLINIKAIKKTKHLGIFDDAIKIITHDHLEFMFCGFTP